MTRLLALDVGEARIGVAVSDAMRMLASPYKTIHVSRDEAQTWAAIQQLIEEADAEELIIGLPISLDGQLHAQAERVLAFADRMKEHISIPFTFWDERLSTVEAQRLLVERAQQARGKSLLRGQGGQRRSRRRQKGHEIDALAAAVILQEYLDVRGRT
jgi:putative Holliday junction resolvase